MLNKRPLTTLQKPVNLVNREFNNNKYGYYEWLRDNDPVHKGKLTVMNFYYLSRYEDCVALTKDPRFVRERSRALGKKSSALPIPLPRSLEAMTNNMLMRDGADHRRLRDLVHQAFTPRRLAHLEARIETLTQNLLDNMQGKLVVDLKQDYCLPIPVTVIAEMLGIDYAEMQVFRQHLNAMTDTLTGLSALKLVMKDLPAARRYIESLIAKKRKAPAEDILTGLIQAEAEGSRLSEDELISMCFLLIVAGYETTVYLLTNAILCLLTHPEQLDALKAQPELIDGAIEESLRYLGPVQATKPYFASEEVTLHGVKIPRGAAVMPLLGAANHDPRQFENPEIFDITRSPNRHLGFSQGIHYCLGAPLARIEARIALKNLWARYPDLRLAIEPEQLEMIHQPGWHKYKRLPVIPGDRTPAPPEG